MTPWTIDFETKAIGSRPADFPPKPVGLALRSPAGKSRYWAWGHPSGNNCTEKQAQKALRAVWGKPKIFHNAGFDLSVAIECWGFPYPPADTVYDSIWATFFAKPYERTYSLKPLAEEHLKMPPEEGEEIRRWLVERKLIRASLKKKWGAFISDAPGDVVGPYAIGDVERTFRLWKKFQGKGARPEATRREQQLLPILLDNERKGVPFSLPRLRADVKKYNGLLVGLEREIHKTFRRSFNIDSNEELADSIEKRYKVKLPLTPKSGERQVNKAAIDAVMPHGRTKGLLLYRSALTQSLSTFLRPWLQMARESGGNVHTHWNSTRGGSERKQNDAGARTARLSSEPNFQNLTTSQEALQIILTRLLGAPQDLPNIRSYVVAPKGMVLFGGDYSQQELRLLAHFEDGPLAEQYRKDKNLQVHRYVQAMIKKVMGWEPDYKKTKILDFAIIYGAGIPGLAAQLGGTEEEASNLKKAYFRAMPSVKELMDELRTKGKNGECITTLGGRDYYTEPGRQVNGRWQTYEYKLLNYLIQGSAADQTKQATINFDHAVKYRDNIRFLILAHDEIMGICPKEHLKKALKLLEESMLDSLQINVPISVDLEYGENWGDMREVLAA